MSNKDKGTFQPDSDVHISYEDQQKINKFAKLNAKLNDLKDEIKSKDNNLKNIEEAVEEIVLLDDDEKIPYLVGEVFIYQDKKKTEECLEKEKQNVESEIRELKKQSSDVKDLMSDLKSHLYGKFGSHINLEAEEDD